MMESCRCGATTVAILVLGLGGVGCAELGPPAGSTATVTQASDDGPGGDTDEIPTQGRFLFGASIDDVLPGAPGELFSVQLDAQQQVGAAVTAVNLSYFGRGAVTIDGSTVFSGTVIMKPTADSTGELRAVYVDGGTDWATYALSWRDSRSARWEALCDGDVAIPIFHSFTRSGAHARPQHGPTDRLSWGCAGGVVMKCWRWGYWGGGVPDDDRDSQWQLNAACTRMARADRCATGTPHTREGTEIQIFDRVGIRQMPPATFRGVTSWPPPVNQWTFEAGWVSGDGGEPAARCTNRLRWTAMPSAGDCAIPLPDPRADVNAEACDDVSLLQSSQWNDLPLVSWTDGHDRVTTIDGYIDQDVTVRPYAATYAPEPATVTQPVLDGTLLRKQTANVADVTEEVFLYTRGGDHVLLTRAMAAALLPAPPNHFSSTTPGKGWIFTSPHHPDFDLVEVHLYRRGPLIVDYTTATPAHRPPLDYDDLGVIGYTPAIAPSK
jgi:hypothetical protein